VPPETDPAIEVELQRIIRAGLVSQTELPAVPPPSDAATSAAAVAAGAAPGRRHNPRRGR
jgi:hypothetical protein